MDNRRSEKIIIGFAVATAKLICLVIFNLFNFIKLIVGIVYVLYNQNKIVRHIINAFLIISFYTVVVLAFVGIFIISYRLF